MTIILLPFPFGVKSPPAPTTQACPGPLYTLFLYVSNRYRCQEPGGAIIHSIPLFVKSHSLDT